MKITDARAAIRSHRELMAGGWSNRDVAGAVRRGVLVRLSRGLYVDAALWQRSHPEDRELIRAVAAHRRLRGGGVTFVLTSAGALHGLPLVRTRASRPHVAGRQVNGQVRASAPFVARHEWSLSEDDVVEVDGIRCTSLSRTVADLLRCLCPEAAISVVDAALRQRAWHEGRGQYDIDEAERFRGEVAAHLAPGSRGVVQARELLALADGRADGPGESISRLYLHRLGFAPRIQVAIAGPKGRDYHIDFDIDEADVWGEFDGAVKYTDAAMRGGDEDAAAVVLREKAREDWIRGTTGRRMIRWGWEHLADLETFAARLAAFGVSLPRSRTEPSSPAPTLIS